MPRVPNDTPSAPATPPAAPASYEVAMAGLEALVVSMESGESLLEASLATYRRRAELVKYCQQVLECVEQQVRVLDGSALKPLGDDNGINGQGDA